MRFFQSAILIFFHFFSNENNLGFHMRYHFCRNFDDYPCFQPKTTFMYYFAHDCICMHSKRVLMYLPELQRKKHKKNKKKYFCKKSPLLGNVIKKLNEINASADIRRSQLLFQTLSKIFCFISIQNRNFLSIPPSSAFFQNTVC